MLLRQAAKTAAATGPHTGWKHMRVALVLLVASLGAGSVRADDDLFLVLPTEDFGSVPARALQVSTAVYVALADKGQKLVAADQVATLKKELSAACGSSAQECATQMGLRSGANKIVWSALYELTTGGAPSLGLDLELFDLRAGVSTAAKQQNKDIRELSRWAEAQTLLLTKATPAFGSLLVTGLPPGAEVYADGIAKGRLPMAAAVRLAPGRHEVELRAGTAKAWSGGVEIRANETTELKRCVNGDVVGECGSGDVDPPPPPPGISPMLIGGLVGIGVGVVGLGTAGIVGGLSNGALQDYQRTPSNELDPIQVDNVIASRNVAIGAAIVGGVALVAGVSVLAVSMMMTESP